MKTQILNWDSPDLLTRVRRCLESNAVIVYPTDTSYGLGADARVKSSIGRVRQLKQRIDSVQPISVCVTIEQLPVYAELNSLAKELVNEFLPGPYTFVFHQTGLLSEGLNPVDADRIGFRVPDHDSLLAFLAEIEIPLTATSANITGKGPSFSIDSIMSNLKFTDQDLVIDEGILPKRKSSTVAIVEEDNFQIIRHGLGVQELERWIEEQGML